MENNNVIRGVPQGSPMSNRLYELYMDQLYRSNINLSLFEKIVIFL